VLSGGVMDDETELAEELAAEVLVPTNGDVFCGD
jgi:hypothetical protein